jgi:hypothetical protein
MLFRTAPFLGNRSSLHFLQLCSHNERYSSSLSNTALAALAQSAVASLLRPAIKSHQSLTSFFQERLDVFEL